MIDIRFFPDSDLNDYSQSVKDFEDIWKEDGQRIQDSLEKAAGLKFKENFINAIVYHRKSFSCPLSLRGGMPKDRAKTVLAHELGHRLIYGTTNKRKDDLTSHKDLFLFFYDALVEIYGEETAKETAKFDSENLPSFYKEAWDWALAIPKEERKGRFEQVIKDTLNGNQIH
jgi:hypothetical protein